MILPGRLGTPGMILRDDPRADPRLVAAIVPLGLGEPMLSPVDEGSPLDAIYEFVDTLEAGMGGAFDALTEGLTPVEGVESRVEVITGVDGNDITLYLHRPADAAGELPGILHLHGGGMALLEAAGGSYPRWRDELAAAGLVVIGVEFRNAAGKLGPHPFPAGLNDCSSALQWMAANKAQLGISKLVVSGESGGGNLALATTLKAKRDGVLDRIDGVYAQCPYPSDRYGAAQSPFPSHYENEDYFISGQMSRAVARTYDPTGANATNPLAWPGHASVDDLRGLPPHVISVNQLDPLRDEGLAYFRKLLDAGVSAVSRTINGTCHGGDLMLRMAMADVYLASVREVKSFADAL
jgi:acetyl esterase/lipase